MKLLLNKNAKEQGCVLLRILIDFYPRKILARIVFARVCIKECFYPSSYGEVYCEINHKILISGFPFDGIL